MWDHRALWRLDFRTVPIILALMAVSLLVISSTTGDPMGVDETFFTPYVKTQMQFFAFSIFAYLFFAGFDYRKLREWTWILYIGMIILLLGLFLTEPIQNVRRWYRIPILNVGLQPSEFAKLIVVLTLSWFLEQKRHEAERARTALHAGLFVLIPFLLVLKQPDLGSALLLLPITLGMFYFGGMSRRLIFWLSLFASMGLFFVILMFLGVISHEEMRPIATLFLKDYQYERLNPNNYHQNAAQISLALGKIFGSGWHKSLVASRHFLPFAHTDSVYPAFVEEFGLVGCVALLGLFFGLIYCSFQVTAVARDYYGRVLSAGITLYLTMHIVINIGMMSGLLPITGVPLIIVSSGGSSVLATMSALGILQSIYTKRFLF